MNNFEIINTVELLASPYFQFEKERVFWHLEVYWLMKKLASKCVTF